jgi:hypothetical protein
MVVCNTTGALAIYNKARDLFMSPMADGPLRFFRSETGKGFALDTMTKYGRRFSIISVPYSFKLLVQELAAINIQLRIITEDNLHQIESMSFSDNINRLTLDQEMTPDKLAKQMEKALKTGERPVQTPKMDAVTEEPPPPVELIRTEDDQMLQDIIDGKTRDVVNKKTSPQYPDVSPAFEPPGMEPQSLPVSPAYEPPGMEPQSLPVQEEKPIIGGSAYSIADFDLGEQVYFTRSADLGISPKHVWRVAKKGGTLLTIATDRGSFVGGNANLTNSDLVQIAKSDELVKIDAFSQWEDQRAGALLAHQQQQQQNQMMQQQYDMMRGGMPQQIPQINIKMVGGNDFSKGDDSAPSEKGVTITGGEQDTAFNNLVIPSSAAKMNGGSSSNSDDNAKKPEKSLLGGLADFGNLVINKIM